MASNLRVDTILPSSGTNVAIGTDGGTVSLVGDNNIITSGNATIGGNLGVGGTLTYEDVTNIDSVGVITARSGISVTSGSISVTSGSIGINTTGGNEKLNVFGAIRSSGSSANFNAGVEGTLVDYDTVNKVCRIGHVNGASGSARPLAFLTGGTQRMSISSEGYVTKPQTPFFSVYGSSSNQTYNQNDTITFENAVQNVGNHFKMTSGTGQYERFYAPVAGVYIFTFGMFPNTASNCRISLAVNGGVQTTPYISGCFTAWGTGVSVPMGSQMLKLSANDYVSVVVQIGTLTNTYDGHTGFQGFLLG